MEVGARVWVRDDSEIWVAGVVEECHEAKHLVRPLLESPKLTRHACLGRLHDGEAGLHLRNDLDDFRDVPNLIQLQYLHEPELLYAVANRFAHDLIYTYIGDILLAFNPFRPLNIYTPRHVREYEAMDADAPPHVFAIASMAYRCMRDEQQNQSILVSGESGAGKTENTKFLMQYLATVGAPSAASAATAMTPAKTRRGKAAAVAPTSTTDIQTQILQTNPILEAFGNAKTVRNDNSSRFGKFIALQFGAAHTIVGAKISVYLLEKIRLSHQSPGERNFHIFYELVAGADDELAEALELGGLEDYAILNQADCYERRQGVDDGAQLALTLRAFQDMGIPDSETHVVLGVVAALLHLGNVAFDAAVSAVSNLEMAAVASAGSDALATAARLLGVAPEALVAALVTRRIHTTREVVEVKLTAAQAEDAKQSLMQSIYGGLFLYIVERLSNIICHDRASAHTIGILDIFGFENLQTNGFEQLCINYANERLQAQFNDLVFAKEQRMYAAEGIEWKYIEYPDNAPCLALLEDRPHGMWCLLDEECILPKGSNEGWITKLYQTFL
ncbi:myosin-like protein, partial [Achlya hypogyna]